MEKGCDPIPKNWKVKSADLTFVFYNNYGCDFSQNTMSHFKKFHVPREEETLERIVS